MKRELIVVLIRLLTIGMFVDGQRTIIKVSVMERDLVTLKSGVTYIKTDDEIEWKFEKIKIATISKDSSGISAWVTPDESFRDRLELDNQTGDLKISNIRTTDSALYKLDISSPDVSSEVEFTVNVLSANKVETLSVRKGDLLTLPTGLSDTQKIINYEIWWRFGEQKNLIAEINARVKDPRLYDGPEGRFRNILEMNQTGHLNITNIRTEHAGLYEVEINITSDGYAVHHTRSITVTVRDKQSPSRVKEGESVTLYTDLTETQTDDKILWKFEDQVIARLNGTPFETSQSNIKLNHQTGDLTISAIKTNQYGEYKLEITTRKMILHRKYQITDPDRSSAAVAGIRVPVVLVAVAVGFLVGVILY